MKKIISQTFIITSMIFIFTFCSPVLVKASNVEVAKVKDMTYSSLKEAIDHSVSGDVIEIIGDTEESETININHGLTINGNNHKIAFNIVNNGNVAFLVATSEKVLFDKVEITVKGRAIAIDSTTHNIFVTNSKLYATERGVTINSDNNVKSRLSIENTIIRNPDVTNYDQEVPNTYLRGISLWEYTDSIIDIKNTIVEGYSYAINFASEAYDAKNTKLTVDGCTLKGRSGINLWTKNLDLNILNSKMVGINNMAGPSETFADIVIYSDSNNITIENTELINYQNEIGLQNPNGLQYLIDVRGINNVIKLSKDNVFIDTTKKLNHVFKINNPQNDVQMNGGLYSYDVKDYVADGYTTKKTDDGYIVGLKATSLEIPDNIIILLGDTYDLKATVEPTDTIEDIYYTSSNDVLTINDKGVIKATKIGDGEIIVKVGDIEKKCKVSVREKVPETGDSFIFIAIGFALTSIIGLIVVNRKKFHLGN